MLSDNLKALRKQKGYSQETMAQQLNVVRQTISKWEKGLSVPDAEMLEQIADLFEVSVDTLLDREPETRQERADYHEIAVQLAVLNEQLALQRRTRRRIWKAVVICLIVMVLVPVLLFGLSFSAFHTVQFDGMVTTVRMECALDGEEYIYEVTFDEQNRVVSAGGDAWIADHVQTEQYSDANILMAQIEDYFLDRGGTFEITN